MVPASFIVLIFIVLVVLLIVASVVWLSKKNNGIPLGSGYKGKCCYDISGGLQAKGPILTTYENISSSDCRKACCQNEDCNSAVYLANQGKYDKQGRCTLLKENKEWEKYHGRNPKGSGTFDKAQNFFHWLTAECQSIPDEEWSPKVVS